jgi:hypothetical protein
MEENRARRVVQGLRAHDWPATMKKAGVYQFGSRRGPCRR